MLGQRLTAFAACIGAIAAVTNSVPVPSSQEASVAFRRMLRYEDVPSEPAELRLVDPGWETTLKADNTLTIPICTLGALTLESTPVKVLYQVELGETNKTVDPVSIEQKVYTFETEAQARAKWAEILKKVVQCKGWYQDTAAGLSQEVTHGRTKHTVSGVRGLWVLDRWKATPAAFRGGSATGAENPNNGEAEQGSSSYFVFFLVPGNAKAKSAIVSVEYDYAERPTTLPAATRAAIDLLAARLSHRWVGSWGWWPKGVPFPSPAPGPINDHRIPSWDEVAKKQALLLRFKDVPPSLPVAQGWEFTATSDNSTRIQLCANPNAAAGGDVTSRHPALEWKTELGEMNGTDMAGMEHKNFEYESAALMRDDWAHIVSRASECTSSKADPEVMGRTLHTVVGRTTAVSSDGVKGLFVHEYFHDGAAVPANAAPGDSIYTVYFRSARNATIVSLQYDYPATLNPLTAAKRRTVDKLALDLATRWETGKEPKP